jgi:hypothetical protein
LRHDEHGANTKTDAEKTLQKARHIDPRLNTSTNDTEGRGIDMRDFEKSTPTPTPTFFVTVDSKGGLSCVFLDLLIVSELQTRFAELFISVELASSAAEIEHEAVGQIAEVALQKLSERGREGAVL